MATRNDHLQLLDAAFEDLALMLGGLAATEPIPANVVARVVQCLAAARQRAHARARRDAVRSRHPRPSPHPAITAFLAELQAGVGRG